MTESNVTAVSLAVSGVLVVGMIISALTIASVQEAKVATACVQSGGEWVEHGNNECRRK